MLSRAEVQAAMDASPFISFMGIVVVEVDPALPDITCRCRMRPEFERLAETGQWHGGVLASLIDTVGDFVVARVAGHAVPTVNFRTDYLRAASTPVLTIRGISRRIGKTIGVVDVEVTSDKGDVVALGRATYAVV